MYKEGEDLEERKNRADRIMAKLDQAYGTEQKMFLKSQNAWQLLIATILSAQCTDDRVNMITERLFKKYRSLSEIASASREELENDIRSAGFYHSKAGNILGTARKIIEDFNGSVPDNIEDLTSLPGVGRKTGNLILGNIYHRDAIVVDTHVKRVSNRLGLADSDDPVKTEFQLMEVLRRQYWIRWNTHIISLGRTYCRSKSPDCVKCFLRDECLSSGNREMIEKTRSKKRNA